MEQLQKVTFGLSITVLLTVGSIEATAGTYTVQKGDTLSGIVYNKLGLKSIDGISVPSGDINNIMVGDVIKYSKKKKKRFQKKKTLAKSTKFCFKDNHSIHYRAQERCK